ncbi:MAG: response regulator transcription factor [Pseudomonadota bacterium]
MAASQAIRIIIADDHAIVREGLRTLLCDEDDIDIIGEAEDGETAVALTARLHPDIILMDIMMPGLSGIEAAQKIQTTKLATKVILLTSMLGDDLRLQEAIDAGVMGYLLKDVSRENLLSAIKSAHAGAPVFHPAVQKQLLRRATGERLPHEDLTPRELDILTEIASGKSNKTIAYDLNLTEGTVKGYVSVVLSKLGVSDRTQAALYAVKHGLTS